MSEFSPNGVLTVWMLILHSQARCPISKIGAREVSFSCELACLASALGGSRRETLTASSLFAYNAS